jgi:hypothetical protein
MNTLSPSAFVFVIKLRGPDLVEPDRLRGRIEHVPSGRRHDFDSSAALLASLRQELAEICRDDESGTHP